MKCGTWAKVKECDPFSNRDKELDPYRDLLLAVLERALLDAAIGPNCAFLEGVHTGQTPTTKKQAIRRVRESATRWLHSDAFHPWSFYWICEQLDFVPQYILRAIRVPEFRKRMNDNFKFSIRGWAGLKDKRDRGLEHE